MTRDEFDEICRQALIQRRLLADFSDGSIDKVTHTIMKIVKNRIEIACNDDVEKRRILYALGLDEDL